MNTNQGGERKMDKLELAFLANGGPDWQGKWCECDPSVGASPCRYCAIYSALSFASALDESVKKLLENNGGPIDSEEGEDTHVMVRREDFDALDRHYQPR